MFFRALMKLYKVLGIFSTKCAENGHFCRPIYSNAFWKMVKKADHFTATLFGDFRHFDGQIPVILA